MGQPTSVAKMVLERLDAEISETDDYRDQDPTPDKTTEATANLASHAAHLAALLKSAAYQQ